jgi:hypothetical protein
MAPIFCFKNVFLPHVSSEHDTYKEFQSFFFEIVLFGMPLVGFCSLRVYRILSQHINIVTALLNKTPEQIQEEKSILKAIVIQALIPMICILPALFLLLMVLLHGWDSPVINMTIFYYGKNQEYQFKLIELCVFIATVFSVLDPFITLRVVKSYRRAANQFLAKFKICRKFTGTGQEDAVVQFVHSRP